MLIISIPNENIETVLEKIHNLEVKSIQFHYESDCILNGNANQEMLDTIHAKRSKRTRKKS